jgi:uncharacterized protein YndB with AHSA1/START domain
MTGDHGARRGIVTRLDDGRQRLHFLRSWPVPVEEVWSVLTAPDRTIRWIGSYEGERAVGATGTFTMTHEEEVAAQPMTILACDRPRQLVVQWVEEAGGGMRVDLELSTQKGGAALRFVQVFDADVHVTDYALGWHWYLDKFEAELAGAPGPGTWDTFLASAGPAYGRP